MMPPWFLPEVLGGSGDLATTSFSTLGSGGKKNCSNAALPLLYKKVPAELGILFPILFNIDSPMKNISE
jgi:hypothetical protein